MLQITQATNSQNPVDLKDLHSNDEKQRRLETSIHDLGFNYRRKRMDKATSSIDITSGAAAEAILAVWRSAPHQAKFMTREHFGKLYDKIFTDDLNGAQTIVAVLLYRIAENHRRRPAETDPVFVRYASSFIAMQMGRHLLKDTAITLENLDHRTFLKVKSLIEEKGDNYFSSSVEDITNALMHLYRIIPTDRQLGFPFSNFEDTNAIGFAKEKRYWSFNADPEEIFETLEYEPISLQQLSATFRRGDLITCLSNMKKFA